MDRPQTNQREAGYEKRIQDVAADAGYHATETLTTFREETPYRTYIP